MFNISTDMNVSIKTETFLITLFTTVGMFCCKDATNNRYIDSLLKAIENVDEKLVYTAIDIRTYENDMWDDLLDNQKDKMTLIFREKYEKHQRIIKK